jgi:hypothetical protein
MSKKIIITAFSVLSLIGVFLPIATNGNIYIDVYQMKDSSSLLYVTSIALVVFSVANFFRKIEDAKLLLITSSLFGLTVLIYSTAEAVKTINYTVQKNVEFENMRNGFLKEFKESRKEVEERQREMEERLSKMWGNIKVNKGNEIHQESIQIPPAADVGLGAYLMALGFLGVLGFSLLPERKSK